MVVIRKAKRAVHPDYLLCPCCVLNPRIQVRVLENEAKSGSTSSAKRKMTEQVR